MFNFSNSWFEYQRPVVEKCFPPTRDKVQILEIGAFEGRSSVFYVDNYLEHPESSMDIVDPFCTEDQTTPVSESTFEIFRQNISQTKYPQKVNLHKFYSFEILPKLEKKYDYITIDGSHLSEDVLVDCVLSYRLLANGGIMFFDDYGSEGVKRAVDCFMSCFETKMETIHSGYHFVAKKKVN